MSNSQLTGISRMLSSEVRKLVVPKSAEGIKFAQSGHPPSFKVTSQARIGEYQNTRNRPLSMTTQNPKMYTQNEVQPRLQRPVLFDEQRLSKAIQQTKKSKSIQRTPSKEYIDMQRLGNSKQQNKIAPPENKKQLLELYEENNRLISKQATMQKQMKELVLKNEQLIKVNRTLTENQIKELASEKKLQNEVRKLGPYKRPESTGKQANNKLGHLLEIIDSYKQKLLLAEQQINNLKVQKQLLQNGLGQRGEQTSLVYSEHENHSMVQSMKQSDKLRTALRQLSSEKQRTRYYELAVKGLEAKVKSLELKVEDFESLKIQIRNLQQQLIRRTNIASIGGSIDRGEEEKRVKQLQSKLKLTNDKYVSLKDINIKLEAELRLQSNKLIELASYADELEKQNAKMKSESISNPILEKLNRDPELLIKVVSEIEFSRGRESNNPNIDKTENYNKIVLQKEQLAKELISCRSKIKVLKQTFKEKERISKIEKEEMMSMISLSSNANQRVVTSKLGVPYDGDISMFSEQLAPIPANTNYFDLFLGEMNLLETMVQAVTNIRNIEILLVMASVDFYNHDTERSKLAQGCKCDLQSQFSYKVIEDDFFFKFLQKGTLCVDIWAIENQKRFSLGKVLIELKSLIMKSKPKVAPVISTSAPIYLNQKVLGSLNLVMRMRLPIYEKVQQLYDKNPVGSVPINEQAPRRKLVIQIIQGQGFNEPCNTFVYYPFRLQDYYTKTFKGSNPKWDNFKMLDVVYDNDMKNYLRKTQLEFTVFDDNAIGDEKDSDVIGTAAVSLLPLLEGREIREKVQVRKGRDRRGLIEIKIFWNDPDHLKSTASPPLKNGVLKLHEIIQGFMKEHRLEPDSLYQQIDSNRSGMVSYEEFSGWIRRISSERLEKEVINQYYNTFKQPVNQVSFMTRLSEGALVEPVSIGKSDMKSGIGMINQILKSNSKRIQKISLKQFLKGKNLPQIICQIDKDLNGYISKKQLLQYFQQHNIQAQVQQQQVSLFNFLKKHQNDTE